jgi:hypothetical protein
MAHVLIFWDWTPIGKMLSYVAEEEGDEVKAVSTLGVAVHVLRASPSPHLLCKPSSSMTTVRSIPSIRSSRLPLAILSLHLAHIQMQVHTELGLIGDVVHHLAGTFKHVLHKVLELLPGQLIEKSIDGRLLEEVFELRLGCRVELYCCHPPPPVCSASFALENAARQGR